MVCLFSGLPLLGLTTQEAVDNWTWMITYGAPIATSAISTCLFLVYYTSEPLEFLLSKDNKEEACRHIKQVYADQSATEEIY